MINLTFKKFFNIAKNNYTRNKILVIPLFKNIVVDTETPVSLFFKLTKKEKFAYLLESADTNLQWGRYSFISFNPYLIFKSKYKNVSIIKNNNNKNYFISPFKKIKQELNTFLLPKNKELYKFLPRFFGGFVGYIGYENVHFIEPSVKIPQSDKLYNLPDIYLMLNNVVLIFDHYLNQLKVVYLAFIEKNNDLKKLYDRACLEIENIIRNIKSNSISLKELNLTSLNINNKDLNSYKSNISKYHFEKIIKKAKKYILDGEIIQVVLSRRLYKKIKLEKFDIYRALRIINPSPYMFYLKFDEIVLIGSSPEVLVRKQLDVIETRPIAGTRPRGENEEKDLEYEKSLLNSKKENAEHIMLVDLARNDIGKISKYHSISIPKFKIIEKFSHVMHLVSFIKAKLMKKFDIVDVLTSFFPAGTVSGAPKVRAMQIISELEGIVRGPYAGCVGYFSLNGNMDMAITIRTIISKNDYVYIQTGAGIVADSLANKEYKETINKAKALILAVKIAQQNYDNYTR